MIRNRARTSTATTVGPCSHRDAAACGRPQATAAPPAVKIFDCEARPEVEARRLRRSPAAPRRSPTPAARSHDASVPRRQRDGLRVTPGNDSFHVMAGRKTRPSRPGEQRQFARRPGLSSRTPAARSHGFRRLASLGGAAGGPAGLAGGLEAGALGRDPGVPLGERGVAGGQIRAERYRFISPYLAGSIWYDGRGHWVKGEFERDGARVEYRLDA
jgi:hypothetical protein